MSRAPTLPELLLDLFTAEDLRRLARQLPGGSQLDSALPGETAAPIAVADALVREARRRGELDLLLEAAQADRPKRAAELAPFRQAAPAGPVLTPPRRAPLPRPCRAFISYSSIDRPHIERLMVSLSLLRRQGLIELWTDHQILPGDPWTEAIDDALSAAQLVLLGISDDFNASDFCYSAELARALDRERAGQVRIVPIFLRPADTEDAPYMRFQGLPPGGKAITEHADPDAAWKLVAKGIRALF